MRNPYAPIFRRTLSSRIWALSPEARCVWLWLKLSADPEGFVNADLAGVAAGANVPREAARRAMEGFASPDPDADPDDPSQGRVVERVRGGWRVLDSEDARALASEENRRSRMRQYMREYRSRRANDPANDTSTAPSPLAPALAQQGTSNKEQQTREEGIPLPPSVWPEGDCMEELREASGASEAEAEQLLRVEARQRLFEASTLPTVLHTLPDDWEPDDELRAEATALGVTDFDARIAQLRTGTIGGARGVLAHKLRDYVRAQLSKWKTWAETDRAKQRAAAQAPAGRGKPMDVSMAGARYTGWVKTFVGADEAFCKKHELDYDAERWTFNVSGAIDTEPSHAVAGKLFRKHLVARAKARKGAAA